MRSSERICIARQCTPGKSKAQGHATARPSKTKSCVSRARENHQIFLEPEGLDDDTIYPNGISTSLPEEVQLELLKTDSGS